MNSEFTENQISGIMSRIESYKSDPSSSEFPIQSIERDKELLKLFLKKYDYSQDLYFKNRNNTGSIFGNQPSPGGLLFDFMVFYKYSYGYKAVLDTMGMTIEEWNA